MQEIIRPRIVHHDDKLQPLTVLLVEHITDVKYILPADNIIAKLSDYNRVGLKTKLRLNPQNTPDLNWELATTVSTKPIPPTTTINYTLPVNTYITTTSTPVMISVKADKP